MKKKILVTLLSFVMVVTMMPLSVFANTANSEKGGNEQASISDLSIGNKILLPIDNQYNVIEPDEAINLGDGQEYVACTILDKEASDGQNGVFCITEDVVKQSKCAERNVQSHYNESAPSLAYSWSNEFFNSMAAISTELSNSILDTTLNDDEYEESESDYVFKAPALNLEGNRVFHLSRAEMEKYFPNSEDRSARMKRGGEAQPASYWTRTIGTKETSPGEGYGVKVGNAGVYELQRVDEQEDLSGFRPAFNLKNETRFEKIEDGEYAGFYKWIAPTNGHTVTFNPDNDEDPWEVTVQDGETVAEPDVPIYDGHDFKGWFKDGETEPFDFDTPITEDLILTAHWELHQWRVTFDPNNYEEPREELVYDGETVAEPEDPSYPGYEFGGWYDGSKRFDFDSEIHMDTDLVARWGSEPIRVNLMSWSDPESYGEFQNEDGTKVDVVYVEFGSTFEVTSDDPSHYQRIEFSDGHVVTAKANEGSLIYGSELSEIPKQPITKECQFEAHFEPNASYVGFYSYDRYGGSGQFSSEQLLIPNGTRYEVTDDGDPVHLKKIVFHTEGEDTVVTCQAGENSRIDGFQGPASGEVTEQFDYFAYFYPDRECTITFDPNNTQSTRTKTIWAGHSVDKPVDPEPLPGYEFDAWQLNGEDYDFSNPVLDDITLVANYTVKTATVSFVADPAGSGTFYDSNSGVDITTVEDVPIGTFYQVLEGYGGPKIYLAYNPYFERNEMYVLPKPATGYKFSKWEVDLDAGNVEDDMTFKAVFEPLPTKNKVTKFPSQGTITVTVDGQEIGEEDLVEAGTTVQLSYTPRPGFGFRWWSAITLSDRQPVTVETDGTDGTFTMPYDDVEVTVGEQGYAYKVSTQADHGTITLDPARSSYQANQKIQLSYTPDEGWQFGGWSVTTDGGKDVDVDENNKFIMPADNVTVKAIETQNKYAINTIQPQHGVIVTSIGGVPVDEAPNGTTITLQYTSTEGYIAREWDVETESGELVEVTDGKFTMPAEAVTVSVTEIRPSFDDLQSDIDNTPEGGTLNLESDYTAIDGEFMIEITKQITINLNGFTIDGDNTQIFDVDESGDLTIKDDSPEQTGTITGGGDSSSWGGAIWNKHMLTIEGGTITGNQASNGGAINNSADGIVKIKGGAITNNKAAIGAGGAINNQAGGTVEIEGGIISGNEAQLGGAISNEGNLKVIGGAITDNKAILSASGILNTGILTVGGSAVINNNTKGDNVPDNVENFSLREATLALDGDAPFTTDAIVGITLITKDGTGTVIASGATEDDMAHFKCDDSTKELVFNSEESSISIVEQAIDYNITLPEIEHGTVTAEVTPMPITNEEATAHAGDLVTLKADMEEGYRVGDFTVITESGELVELEDNTFTMPEENVIVSVSELYTIKTLAEHGEIMVSPSLDLYEKDTEITLNYEPATGYKLGAWEVTTQGGGTVTVDNNKFTMPADNVTVKAREELEVYEINNGTSDEHVTEVNFTVDGEEVETAHYGEEVTVVPAFEDEYELDTITVDGEAITGNTFTMPANDVTVTVTSQVTEYDLNVTSDEHVTEVNFTVDGEEVETAHYGDEVTVVPAFEEGYELDTITVDGAPMRDNTFTMPPRDVNVDVTSKVAEYTIGIDYDENVDEVVVKVDGIQADKAHYGDEVTIESTFNEGYELNEITVDGEAITGNTFTMPANNVNVYVASKATDYIIGVVRDGNVEDVVVKVNGIQADKAHYRDVVTVEPEFKEGYELKEITVNGVPIKEDTFKMPSQNIEIGVTSQQTEYDIDESHDSHISQVIIEVNGEPKDSAHYNDEVTVKPTFREGYELDEITVMQGETEIEVDEDGTFIMPAGDVKINVTSKQIDYDISKSYDMNVEDVIITVNGQQVEQAHYRDKVVVTPKFKTGYELNQITVDGEKLIGNTFVMPSHSVEIYVDSVQTDYNITLPELNHGKVTAEVLPPPPINEEPTAHYGDRVTLTADMEEGYQVGEFTVETASGIEVPLSVNEFTMPAEDVIVYVQELYTIDASAEHGTVTITPSQDVYEEGEEITLSYMSETGYQAIGWIVTTQAGQTIEVIDNSFIMPADNVTVRPIERENGYNITPVLPLHEGVTSIITIIDGKETTYGKAGEVVTIDPSFDPSYDQGEITVMAGSQEIEVINNQFTMPASNVTVDVTAALVQFEVTFDINDGTHSPESIMVPRGKPVTRPVPDPEKPGYKFLGWFAEGAETVWDFETPIFNDMTLTAHWQEDGPIVPPTIEGFEAWGSDPVTTNVKWDKATDPRVEYFVYRGATPTGDWGDNIGILDNNQTTFTQTVKQSNIKYYYMVRAGIKKADGKYVFGPYTKVDYAWPRVIDVEGFESYAPNATQANIVWTPIQKPGVQYWIYRGDKPYGDWGAPIAKVSDLSKGLYVDKNAKPGQKNYYLIRAVQVIDGKTYFGDYTSMDYAWPR